MKTPRELLLQRHQAVEAKLNAVRHRALAAARPGLLQSWREFLVSMRWHLAGISAVWIAVLSLQLDSTSSATGVFANGKVPSARVLLASLLESRREIIQLTETPTSSLPPALPPRRSEIHPASEVA